MRILDAALIYFALVFAAGFVLGSIRVPLLVPGVGERTAELLEAPFMLAASILSARFVVRRVSLTGRERLAAGLLALAFMLGAEIAVGLALRRQSLPQILFDRDPVAGTAYYVLLGLFTVMPWWIGIRSER